MKREKNTLWEEAKKHAELVVAKRDLKTVRSMFVAEYTDRVCLSNESNRLLIKNRSLGGKNGVLKKKIRAMILCLKNVERELRRLSENGEFDTPYITVFGRRLRVYFGEVADKILSAIEKGGAK